MIGVRRRGALHTAGRGLVDPLSTRAPTCSSFPRVRALAVRSAPDRHGVLSPSRRVDRRDRAGRGVGKARPRGSRGGERTAQPMLGLVSSSARGPMPDIRHCSTCRTGRAGIEPCRSPGPAGSTSCTCTTRSRTSARNVWQIVGTGAPRVVTTLHGSDVTQIGAIPRTSRRHASRSSDRTASRCRRRI